MAASDNIAPFEGPEKLLEIWFAPHVGAVPAVPSHDDVNPEGHGLRAVKRHVWEDMLDLVKCKVLSVVSGNQIDAYLLSESSLFVFPHKLILKTCGTTLNLLGLPRILEIAKTLCNLTRVWRCFYSRKSFMFPERQTGPHTDWGAEVRFLDDIFAPTGGGAAYTVGKVNGDHWLLYMTTPQASDGDGETVMLEEEIDDDAPEDYTIEILMSDLAAPARELFFTPELESSDSDAAAQTLARELSEKLGITGFFPPSNTTLDAYSFTPCGYSANALVSLPVSHTQSDVVQTGLPHQAHDAQEGYYTIHVTPEEGWSYASFECNVQLRATPAGKALGAASRMPDLQTLVQRVVHVFQPGRLSVTLFVSAPSDSPPPSPVSDTASMSTIASTMSSASNGDDLTAAQTRPPPTTRRDTSATLIPDAHPPSDVADLDDLYPEGQVEKAQRAFLQALSARGYRRTDKINYEFRGYDLAFASFELKGKGKKSPVR
ncbi:S-adenosylmethionine decarboxylase [Auriculariales sp. MPI-PUGE-AT-0066]|nr:S-adenosylmethionine decarboxylase [Auriculariales sp. MPI-PUGE-AT-0066]